MWLRAKVSSRPSGVTRRWEKEGAGVVDQHVDARLTCRDRRSDLARFRHAREIRQMHAMAEPGRFRLELAHRRLRASFVAGDEDDASAEPREREDRGFADARGRAGGDDGLALHRMIPWLRLEASAI